MQVTRVNIRKLRDRLSYYLRLTKAGRVIEITERGKPIGRIVPIESSVQERLEAAAKCGLLSWNGKKLEDRPPVAKLKGKKTVAEIVVEDRK